MVEPSLENIEFLLNNKSHLDIVHIEILSIEESSKVTEITTCLKMINPI